MKANVLLLMLTLVLWPALSDARCRTVGESASRGTELGTFPLYPAKRVVEAGEKRDSAALQWVGYGMGLPLFVVAMPFAMVGAGVGAVLHPWTKCDQQEDDWLALKCAPVFSWALRRCREKNVMPPAELGYLAPSIQPDNDQHIRCHADRSHP